MEFTGGLLGTPVKAIEGTAAAWWEKKTFTEKVGIVTLGGVVTYLAGRIALKVIKPF